jgi:hypothetical protein
LYVRAEVSGKVNQNRPERGNNQAVLLTEKKNKTTKFLKKRNLKTKKL